MTTEQKTVAVGAASGVATMALLVWALYQGLPVPPVNDDTLSRLIFTLRLDVLALVPLFLMLIVVGNDRFLTKGINPLYHAEDRATEINGRVADNTMQQTLVFIVSTLALSTFLTADSIRLVVALVSVFILARLVFWLGYRINPLYRAPGMAGTAYMNLGIIISVLYMMFTTI